MVEQLALWPHSKKLPDSNASWAFLCGFACSPYACVGTPASFHTICMASLMAILPWM